MHRTDRTGAWTLSHPSDVCSHGSVHGGRGTSSSALAMHLLLQLCGARPAYPHRHTPGRNVGWLTMPVLRSCSVSTSDPSTRPAFKYSRWTPRGMKCIPRSITTCSDVLQDREPGRVRVMYITTPVRVGPPGRSLRPHSFCTKHNHMNRSSLNRKEIRAASCAIVIDCKNGHDRPYILCLSISFARSVRVICHRINGQAASEPHSCDRVPDPLC